MTRRKYTAARDKLILAARARAHLAMVICQDNKKPVEKWKGVGVRTADELEEVIINHPDATLLGILTGEQNNLYVVDIDPKNGGQAWLLKNRKELQCDYEVRTRSGGVHLYFTMPAGDWRNTAGRLAPGVDTRGEGGYVIAWDALEPAMLLGSGIVGPMPAWLLTELQELDARPALPAAGDVVPEGQRDETLFRLACSLRERGRTPEEILTALVEVQCDPPVPMKDLKAKVKQACKYPAGPRLDAWEPAAIKAGKKPEPVEPFQFGNYRDVLNEPPPLWLVGDFIARKQVSLCYGPPNSGKSAFAVMLAAALSTGVHRGMGDLQIWNNYVGVHYIAMEGSIGPRLRALKKEGLLPDAPHPLHITSKISLPADLNGKLQDEIIAALEQCPSLGLVIIDTLSRASTVDENSAEIGLIAAKCSELAVAYDIHIMLIHHTGKDTDRGARGHSSLKAAVDTEVEFIIEKDPATKAVTRRHMAVTKQRDGESLWGRDLELKVHDLGSHPDCATMLIRSVTVTVVAGAAVRPAQRPKERRLVVGSDAQAIWTHIQRAIENGVKEFTAGELREMIKKHQGNMDGVQEKKRVARVIDALTKYRGGKWSAYGKDYWKGVLSFVG